MEKRYNKFDDLSSLGLNDSSIFSLQEDSATINEEASADVRFHAESNRFVYEQTKLAKKLKKKRLEEQRKKKALRDGRSKELSSSTIINASGIIVSSDSEEEEEEENDEENELLYLQTLDIDMKELEQDLNNDDAIQKYFVPIEYKKDHTQTEWEEMIKLFQLLDIEDVGLIDINESIRIWMKLFNEKNLMDNATKKKKDDDFYNFNEDKTNEIKEGEKFLLKIKKLLTVIRKDKLIVVMKKKMYRNKLKHYKSNNISLKPSIESIYKKFNLDDYYIDFIDFVAIFKKIKTQFGQDDYQYGDAEALGDSVDGALGTSGKYMNNLLSKLNSNPLHAFEYQAALRNWTWNFKVLRIIPATTLLPKHYEIGLTLEGEWIKIQNGVPHRVTETRYFTGEAPSTKEAKFLAASKALLIMNDLMPGLRYKPGEIPKEWMRWIDNALVSGCDVSKILSVLRSKGFSPHLNSLVMMKIICHYSLNKYIENEEKEKAKEMSLAIYSQSINSNSLTPYKKSGYVNSLRSLKSIVESKSDFGNTTKSYKNQNLYESDEEYRKRLQEHQLFLYNESQKDKLPYKLRTKSHYTNIGDNNDDDEKEEDDEEEEDEDDENIDIRKIHFATADPEDVKKAIVNQWKIEITPKFLDYLRSLVLKGIDGEVLYKLLNKRKIFLKSYDIEFAQKLKNNEFSNTSSHLLSHDIYRHTESYKLDPDSTIPTHQVPPSSVSTLLNLYHACRFGYDDYVELYCQCNVNINEEILDPYSNERLSPILIAARYGHEKIIQILLKYKANIYNFNNKGRNALHFAALYGHANLINVLVDNGIPLFHFDYQGYLPIHYAIEKNYHDFVKSLLLKSVDVTRQILYNKVYVLDPGKRITIDDELSDDEFGNNQIENSFEQTESNEIKENSEVEENNEEENDEKELVNLRSKYLEPASFEELCEDLFELYPKLKLKKNESLRFEKKWLHDVALFFRRKANKEVRYMIPFSHPSIMNDVLIRFDPRPDSVLTILNEITGEQKLIPIIPTAKDLCILLRSLYQQAAVDSVDQKYFRTGLHLACYYNKINSHEKIVSTLINEFGSNVKLKDKHGMRPIDLLMQDRAAIVKQNFNSKPVTSLLENKINDNNSNTSPTKSEVSSSMNLLHLFNNPSSTSLREQMITKQREKRLRKLFNSYELNDKRNRNITRVKILDECIEKDQSIPSNLWKVIRNGSLASNKYHDLWTVYEEIETSRFFFCREAVKKSEDYNDLRLPKEYNSGIPIIPNSISLISLLPLVFILLKNETNGNSESEAKLSNIIRFFVNKKMVNNPSFYLSLLGLIPSSVITNGSFSKSDEVLIPIYLFPSIFLPLNPSEQNKNDEEDQFLSSFFLESNANTNKTKSSKSFNKSNRKMMKKKNSKKSISKSTFKSSSSNFFRATATNTSFNSTSNSFSETVNDSHQAYSWFIPPSAKISIHYTQAIEYMRHYQSIFLRQCGDWFVYKCVRSLVTYYYHRIERTIQFQIPTSLTWKSILLDCKRKRRVKIESNENPGANGGTGASTDANSLELLKQQQQDRYSFYYKALGYAQEWYEMEDRFGNMFYYNTLTQVCDYEQPIDAIEVPPSQQLCAVFQIKNLQCNFNWFSCEQCNRAWKTALSERSMLTDDSKTSSSTSNPWEATNETNDSNSMNQSLIICEPCIARCHQGHKGIRYMYSSPPNLPRALAHSLFSSIRGNSNIDDSEKKNPYLDASNPSKRFIYCMCREVSSITAGTRQLKKVNNAEKGIIDSSETGEDQVVPSAPTSSVFMCQATVISQDQRVFQTKARQLRNEILRQQKYDEKFPPIYACTPPLIDHPLSHDHSKKVNSCTCCYSDPAQGNYNKYIKRIEEIRNKLSNQSNQIQENIDEYDAFDKEENCYDDEKIKYKKFLKEKNDYLFSFLDKLPIELDEENLQFNNLRRSWSGWQICRICPFKDQISMKFCIKKWVGRLEKALFLRDELKKKEAILKKEKRREIKQKRKQNLLVDSDSDVEIESDDEDYIKFRETLVSYDLKLLDETIEDDPTEIRDAFFNFSSGDSSSDESDESESDSEDEESKLDNKSLSTMNSSKLSEERSSSTFGKKSSVEEEPSDTFSKFQNSIETISTFDSSDDSSDDNFGGDPFNDEKSDDEEEYMKKKLKTIKSSLKNINYLHSFDDFFNLNGTITNKKKINSSFYFLKKFIQNIKKKKLNQQNQIINEIGDEYPEINDWIQVYDSEEKKELDFGDEVLCTRIFSLEKAYAKIIGKHKPGFYKVRFMKSSQQSVPPSAAGNRIPKKQSKFDEEEYNDEILPRSHIQLLSKRKFYFNMRTGASSWSIKNVIVSILNTRRVKMNLMKNIMKKKKKNIIKKKKMMMMIREQQLSLLNKSNSSSNLMLEEDDEDDDDDDDDDDENLEKFDDDDEYYQILKPFDHLFSSHSLKLPMSAFVELIGNNSILRKSYNEEFYEYFIPFLNERIWVRNSIYNRDKMVVRIQQWWRKKKFKSSSLYFLSQELFSSKLLYNISSLLLDEDPTKASADSKKNFNYDLSKKKKNEVLKIHSTYSYTLSNTHSLSQILSPLPSYSSCAQSQAFSFSSPLFVSFYNIERGGWGYLFRRSVPLNTLVDKDGEEWNEILDTNFSGENFYVCEGGTLGEEERQLKVEHYYDFTFNKWQLVNMEGEPATSNESFNENNIGIVRKIETVMSKNHKNLLNIDTKRYQDFHIDLNNIPYVEARQQQLKQYLKRLSILFHLNVSTSSTSTFLSNYFFFEDQIRFQWSRPPIITTKLINNDIDEDSDKSDDNDEEDPDVEMTKDDNEANEKKKLVKSNSKKIINNTKDTVNQEKKEENKFNPKDDPTFYHYPDFFDDEAKLKKSEMKWKLIIKRQHEKEARIKHQNNIKKVLTMKNMMNKLKSVAFKLQEQARIEKENQEAAETGEDKYNENKSSNVNNIIPEIKLDIHTRLYKSRQDKIALEAKLREAKRQEEEGAARQRKVKIALALVLAYLRRRYYQKYPQLKAKSDFNEDDEDEEVKKYLDKIDQENEAEKLNSQDDFDFDLNDNVPTNESSNPKDKLLQLKKSVQSNFGGNYDLQENDSTFVPPPPPKLSRAALMSLSRSLEMKLTMNDIIKKRDILKKELNEKKKITQLRLINIEKILTMTRSSSLLALKKIDSYELNLKNTTKNIPKFASKNQKNLSISIPSLDLNSADSNGASNTSLEISMSSPRTLLRRKMIRNLHIAMKRQEYRFILCSFGCGDWFRMGHEQQDHEMRRCSKRILPCSLNCPLRLSEEQWLKEKDFEEDMKALAKKDSETLNVKAQAVENADLLSEIFEFKLPSELIDSTSNPNNDEANDEDGENDGDCTEGKKDEINEEKKEITNLDDDDTFNDDFSIHSFASFKKSKKSKKKSLHTMSYQQFHELHECPKRLVPCPYHCLELVPYMDLYDHVNFACIRRPTNELKCRLGCGEVFPVGIVENLLAAEDSRISHETDGCIYRTLRCTFVYPDGSLCAHTMRACDSEAHRNQHTLSQGILTFTVPGEYIITLPSNVTHIKVQCWGAGGGSGRFSSRAGGHGGGGALVEAIVPLNEVKGYDRAHLSSVIVIRVGERGEGGIEGKDPIPLTISQIRAREARRKLLNKKLPQNGKIPENNVVSDNELYNLNKILRERLNQIKREKSNYSQDDLENQYNEYDKDYVFLNEDELKELELVEEEEDKFRYLTTYGEALGGTPGGGRGFGGNSSWACGGGGGYSSVSFRTNSGPILLALAGGGGGGGSLDGTGGVNMQGDPPGTILHASQGTSGSIYQGGAAGELGQGVGQGSGSAWPPGNGSQFQAGDGCEFGGGGGGGYFGGGGGGFYPGIGGGGGGGSSYVNTDYISEYLVLSASGPQPGGWKRIEKHNEKILETGIDETKNVKINTIPVVIPLPQASGIGEWDIVKGYVGEGGIGTNSHTTPGNNGGVRIFKPGFY